MNQKIWKSVVSQVVAGDKGKFVMRIDKELCNNFGVVHGGAVHLIYLTLQKHHLDVSLPLSSLIPSSITIQFLSSIKASDTITVTTEYSKIFETDSYLSRCQIVKDNENILALCSSILKVGLN